MLYRNRMSENEKGLKPIAPELKSILERTKAIADERKGRFEVSNEAKAAAQEMHEAVAPAADAAPEQLWLPMAPMPTDMCRVSPFFPLSKNQLAERGAVRDLVITKSSWGEIRYTGFKLSTYDEDVLLAFLAIIDDANSRQEIDVDGQTTYTYNGPLKPILEFMGYAKVGSKDYKRVMESLELMTATSIKMTTKAGKILVNSLLTAATWDKNTKRLTVTVNPYFYECYVRKTVTLLDVKKRSMIKGAVSKSLYRFISSHRSPEWSGHLLTLAATLNLDLEQPKFRIKATVSKAVAELKRQGFLAKSSKIMGDIVHLVRVDSGAQKAIPAGKAKPKK